MCVLLHEAALGASTVSDRCHCYRVPDYSASDRYDLHRFQGASISLDSRLHYFQELDYHSYCVRRGLVVRWLGDWPDAFLLWLDGVKFDNRCVGRYQTCAWEQRRCYCQGLYLERWIHLDVDQLSLHVVLRSWDAQADQVDQLQGLWQYVPLPLPFFLMISARI